MLRCSRHSTAPVPFQSFDGRMGAIQQLINKCIAMSDYAMQETHAKWVYPRRHGSTSIISFLASSSGISSFIGVPSLTSDSVSAGCSAEGESSSIDPNCSSCFISGSDPASNSVGPVASSSTHAYPFIPLTLGALTPSLAVVLHVELPVPAEGGTRASLSLGSRLCRRDVGRLLETPFAATRVDLRSPGMTGRVEVEVEGSLLPSDW